jgi:H+/gluconate symporter-like permease
MREDLKKKAEELEQTLEMQMSLAKKESEDLVKIGGAILIGGVIAFLAVRLFIGKKDKKTEKILKVLEKEGLLDEEVQSKLTKKNQPGFLGRLSAVLVPIAINYGREQLIKKFKETGSLEVQDEE